MTDAPAVRGEILVICTLGASCAACSALEGTARVRRADRFDPEAPGVVVLHTRGRDPYRQLPVLGWPPSPSPPLLVVLMHGGRPEDAAGWVDLGADAALPDSLDPRVISALVAARLRWNSQERLVLEEAQHRIATETAGAAAHELSQPLTALIGHAEMIAARAEPGSPFRHDVERLLELGLRCGEILDRIRRVKSYASREYLDELRILDLDLSQERPPDASASAAEEDEARRGSAS